jgi:hypothetical protein
LGVPRTNGRRRRNPSTRNVRQSLGHGRGILCPYAYCYSSGTGECADWCHHHAGNQKSKIRSHKTSGALLAGQRFLVNRGSIPCFAPRPDSQRQIARVAFQAPPRNRLSFFPVASVTALFDDNRYCDLCRGQRIGAIPCATSFTERFWLARLSSLLRLATCLR